jgi:hypothetical protein
VRAQGEKLAGDLGEELSAGEERGRGEEGDDTWDRPSRGRKGERALGLGKLGRGAAHAGKGEEGSGCWAAERKKERGKRWAAREGPAQELLLPSFASSFSFSFPTLSHSNNSI